MPIYIYSDNAQDAFTMYLILRCPICKTFAYVDRFQKWKLCPVCGNAYEVARVPAYIEVQDFHEAEKIVAEMQKYLQRTKRKDFTPEETEELRHHYAVWLRKKA